MCIAVFFGGNSNESEVSVITGTMVCNVLKKAGQKVLPVFVTAKGEFLTSPNLADVYAYKTQVTGAPLALQKGGVWLCNGHGKPKRFQPVSVAVNCMHGGVGEGGGLAGLCQMLSIPLLGTGVLASSLALDKCATKQYLSALGVPVVPYVYCTSVGDIPQATQKIGFPAIVKPCHLGSSVGVSVVQNEAALKSALVTALQLDDGALVERYVEGKREVNCAVYALQGEVHTSACEEVLSSGSLLSYADKYEGGAKSVLPADLPQGIAESITLLSKKVYVALSMTGIVRFDFLVEGEAVYLSEVNTTPGSLSQYLVSKGYTAFGKLLVELGKEAQANFNRQSQKLVVHTGILQNFTSRSITKFGVK